LADGLEKVLHGSFLSRFEQLEIRFENNGVVGEKSSLQFVALSFPGKDFEDRIREENAARYLPEPPP
jgi:hypothetical protein